MTCRTCSDPVLLKDPARPGSQSWYCSYQCRRAQVNAAKPKATRVFITDCVACGRTFVSRYTTTTCSTTCAKVKRRDDKQEHKHRGRARKRAAFAAPVSRRAIYERDNYCCHLCGERVLLDQPVPHPQAAVLDHVVPLALGGTHEPDNVRTACFLCNCIKGARLVGSH